jgi:beta-N-acetylglucosaminidase
LAVRLEPDSNSEKLATLKKGNEVKIQKIDGDWLYISSKENNGYIAKDCITNINPNSPVIEENEEGYDKATLIKGLDFNMNLNNPSGFTLAQFKKVLEGQSSDKNGVFEQNAEYFYYAEKQYSINGIFLAAVAIHESGWGTSTISISKKNLFGYGAVDSNPYGGAYTFETYAEGIDLLARVFKKYYLNPAGTAIYDGNVANGKFYNGTTLSAINVKYASDKNWANSVYKWIQHLYNSL